MRFAASEVDSGHANLRHMLFVCSCGLAGDQMVASEAAKQALSVLSPQAG
jgi:hypothetical protein